jgi:N6-adenosine-specific RNA methylase IME4
MIMNSSPLRSRGGHTPFELFLLQTVPTTTLIQTTTVVGEAIMKDSNKAQENYLKLIAQMTKDLEESWSKAYEFTQLHRAARNKLDKKKYHSVNVQYQPGDFVLKSSAGTKSSKNKIRLEWTGPWQITEIMGNNVYRLSSIGVHSGESDIVHSSRLWFYEPSGYVPEESVVAVFNTNNQMLDIEELLELREFENQVQVKIRWYGLEGYDANWENLEEVYKSVPVMISKFVETQLEKKIPVAKAAQRLLKKWQRTEDRVNQIIINWPKQVNEITYLEDLHRHLQDLEVRHPVDPPKERKYTKDWTWEEELVLEGVIQRYGMGKWEAICKSLPAKRKSQIYSKLQRKIGHLALKPYHGLTLKISEFGQWNRDTYGTFVRRPAGSILTSKEEGNLLLEALPFVVENPQTKVELFYRRPTNPIWIEEIAEARANEQYLVLNDVEEDALINQNNIDKDQLRQKLWDILAELRHHWESRTEYIDVQYTDNKHALICFNDWVLQLNRLENVDWEMQATYQGRLIGDIIVSWYPKCFHPIRCDLSKLSLKQIDEEIVFKKGDVPRLYLVDPPWNAKASKDPQRGALIDYETWDDASILRFLSLAELGDEVVIAIWVINVVLAKVMEVLECNGYQVRLLFWIKESSNGNLQSRIGYYLQSAKEILLIVNRGGTPISDIGGVKGPARAASQKPEEMYLRLEEVFEPLVKVDVFARSHNLREGWVSIGNETKKPNRYSIFEQ